MAQGFENINFKINFQAGDRTAFATLKKELTEMKQLAQNVDFGLDQNSANKVISTANSIEKAMTKAYDPQLNTVNIQKFNNLLKQSGTDIKQVQQNLSIMGSSGNNAFMKMTAQLMEINPAIKQTNAFLDDLSKTLFNTIKYTIFNNLLSSISTIISQSYHYVKDLDKSLNDIRIVTGKSADEMERFAEQANDAAKSLAVTTKDYTQGSLIYYQQGLDDETVKTLTDITAKTSNVTQQSMSTVSEQLTAVWNGYQVANQAAEEGMQVYEEYVDKMAAVGATTASDLEELSTAMSKVASAASSMGVDFDDLNAQIATIVSVTRQAPESVGTALKTIYARLGDLKVDGVDEFGTKLGEVSSQLQIMGINIIDQQGNMRNMSEVIAEVAEKQDTWTSAQRQAAAVAMAGKRQYNNLIALFDNQDMYGEALETSMNAAGTLEKQQEIALDSIANKMDVLRATAEDLYDSLFDTKAIGGFVDAGTGVLQFLADFTDSVDGLNNILPLVIFSLTQLFNKQIAAGAESIITNLTRTADAAALAEQNMKQLELIFADSSFQKGQDKEGRLGIAFEQGQGQLNNLYQQIGQYQSIMNEQEKQNYDLLIKQQLQINTQRNELAEMIDTLEGVHNEYGLITKDTLKNAQNSELQSNNIKILNDLTEKLGHNLTRMETAEAKGTESYFRFMEGTQNFGGVNSNAIENQMSNLQAQFKLTDEQYNALVNSINTANFNTAKQSLQSLINTLKDTSERASEVEQRTVDLETAQSRVANFANAMSNQIDLRKVLVDTTQMISALGRLAMSINTLKNLGRIQNNDDLSAGDKILQTVMNLSFALPGLTAAFSTFNKVFNFSSLTTVVNTLLEKRSAILLKNAAAQAAHNSVAKITETIDKVRLTQLAALIPKEEMDAVAEGKKTAAEVANIAVTKSKTRVTEQELIALKAHISYTAADTNAVNASTAANKAFNASMLASPIGQLLIALAGLVAILAAVDAHYRKVAEAARKTAEESKKAADAFNEEAEAHQKLLDEFNDLNQQYKDGAIEKEALQEVTDKLIDAYQLETNIIDKLTGNYDALAEAAKNAREEEAKQALQKTRKSIRDTGESIRKDAKKSAQQLYFDIDNSGPNQIGYQPNDEVKKIQKEIFGDKIDSYGDFQYDASKTSDIVDAVEKIDLYISKLEELGYTENEFNLKNLKDQRDAQKNSEQYQNAAESIELYKKQLLEFSNLDLATTQEEFNEEVEQLKADFQKGMEDGYISSMTDEELDSYILNYVSKLNTAFSEKFSLDSALEKKFGPELTNKLNKYSPEIIKALLSSGFDLSLIPIENIDEFINDFKTSIETNPNSVVSIPAAFQLDMNEKILGGKDIAKEDQETLLASNYNAESILGDRESFNNKSIGERIALMQQLNAVTLAQNKNAIEHYDILKQTNNDLIKEAEAEIELKNNQIKKDTSYIEYLKATSRQQELSKEEQDALIQKIKDTKSEVEQLTDKKYELEVELNLESITDNLVQNVVGEVITSADQMKAAAESIGKEQTVAAEDVATFAAAFPELMEGMERQADGSLKLSKEIVNTELEGAQQRIEANKQVAIKAAEDKIKQLKLEVQFKEEQEKILTEALEGEKTAEEVKTALADAAFDYQQQLLDNGLITQADALTKSQIQEKTAVDGMINILQGLNDSINIIHQNFANMLTTDTDMIDLNNTAGAIKQITASSVDTSLLEQNGFNTSDIDAMIKARDQLRNEISQEKTQIASYEGFISDMMKSASDMDKAANRVKKGLAGKEDKSKSGSSKDKDKEQKEQEDEFDRYWEIKKAIDAVDIALKKLDKDKQNLYGYELINALKQENELLEQQAANYNTLYEMQQQEAAELREQLGTMGLMFDASGAITNYAAATSAALQQYAAAIEQYNAGLIDETTLKVYEKSYENFKKLLERYDKLYYTEMQQTQEKLDEIRRKELANNLKAWEVEIQIHLDKEKMKRDWNDFLKDIKQDFRKVFSDLTIDVKYDEKNFKSLVNDVQTTTKAIGDVEAEIDKMMAGGDSTMFESVSQAQEKLKELQEQLLDQGKALRELYKQVQETYLNGIDQVKDQFDELMSRYEKFNDELEFHKELIELLYGDKAYDLMDKYYETQTKNIEAQIESLRKQADFQQSEFQKSYETAIKSGSKVDMDDFTTQTEDMKKAYENMIEAQGNLNDLVLEGVKILQDQYLNSINKIMDAMDKNVWGRDGFEGMKDNQEFMQKMADEYLDAVEGGAKIQLFANRMDMDKANASSLKAQQKIQAFREKEIEALREKENLTQADIDLAEARYQIMLKEIALEDAQNNKTSMKLTRNEQGNQSYQYVADEDDIGQKQQDLLQSYADLYKLADDSYNHAMELSFDLYEEYTEKLQEIAIKYKDNEEMYLQKKKELDDLYYPQFIAAAQNAELYKQEAMQATAGVFKTVCDQDETAYDTLTDEQKRMVDELKERNFEDYDDMRSHLIDEFYPDLNKIVKEVFESTNVNSQTTAAAVIGQWATDPSSVKNEINKAVSAMQRAIQEYEKELDKLQQIADMDFSKIGESIDKVSQKIDAMGGTTDKMVNNSSQYLDELRRALEAIADKQNSVIEQILSAQRAMQEYINLAAQARAANAAAQSPGSGKGSTEGTNGGNKGTGDNPKKTPDVPSEENHDIIGGQTGRLLYANYPGSIQAAVAYAQSRQGEDYGEIYHNGTNVYVEELKTGGYTGTQNNGDSNGRLAVLHQKELVLNADDTENFLSGIKLIRDMTSLNGSINDAIANAVANMMFALNRTYSNPILTASERENITPNIFNITAEFPNANDVNEIREAILSLPNLASQYISQNTI